MLDGAHYFVAGQKGVAEVKQITGSVIDGALWGVVIGCALVLAILLCYTTWWMG